MLPRIHAGEVLTLRAGTDTLVVWRQDGLYLTAENEKLSAMPVDEHTLGKLGESIAEWRRQRNEIEIAWTPRPATRGLEIPNDRPPFFGRGSGGTWHSHFITLDDGRWLECVILHNEDSGYGAMVDVFSTEIHTAESARAAMARFA